jgi:hypothetical protein
MWAKFMKAATRNDKPEWLTPPAGVTTANVCRLSGLLATEGCQDVEVVDNHGATVRRSLVYTEYFARGTVPTGYCDIHPTHGFMTKVAGLFGAQEKPTPPRIADTGAPVVPAAAAPAPSAADHVDEIAAPPPPPQKKRGFWSKVFGIGKRSERDHDADPASPKNEPVSPKKKSGG